MKIAEGLEMLEISGSMFGAEGVFHPVVMWDDKDVVLFDAALPGQKEVIKGAFEKAGISFDRLNKIIITHQDTDHIGSLASIVKEAATPIEVYAHPAEKPYIQGELTPIKMTPERKAQIEKMLSQLPEEKRNMIKNIFSNTAAKVDHTVEDGQVLPFCGGIEVIHTPGHTPGHICVYLKKYKALITGDAMNVVQGKLCGPNPQHTYNMEDAVKSLNKLSNYDVETVICYHGGVYCDNANERIKELL